MAAVISGQEVWTIGRWRFDAALGSLSDGSEVHRLELRAAATLAVLCRRRGEVVTRQELLGEVWQGRAVSPNSVAVVIADLRRHLGDDAKAPVLLLTLAKRGYRLAPEPIATAPVPTVPTQPRRRKWPILTGISALSALLVWTAVGIGRPAPSASVRLSVGAVRNDTGLARDAGLAASLHALLIDQLANDPRLTVVDGGSSSKLSLSSTLVLWSGLPTIHMVARERATGEVVWSGMAVADRNNIADATIRRLVELRTRLRSRYRSV